MILSNREAAVLERIRVQQPRNAIAKDLGVSEVTVKRTIRILIEKSALFGYGNGRYKVLADAYEVSSIEDKPAPPPPRPAKLGVTIHIPEGYEEYIRGHYGIIPRRELARRLNLDKVTLNLMIMQLGIGGAYDHESASG